MTKEEVCPQCQNQGQWVPVSEALPVALDKQAKCLITVLYPDGTLETALSGYWEPDGWAIEVRWRQDKCQAKIIAWQYRSKPYTPQEVENDTSGNTGSGEEILGRQ